MTLASILCHGVQVFAVHIGDDVYVCPLCGRQFLSAKPRHRRET